MPALLVVSGPALGDYFRLGRSSMVIGRGERNTIQLLDSRASRRHAVVAYDKGRYRYRMRDLESANGTRVNDVVIRGEVMLADGDIVQIGSTELLFSTVDYADPECEFEHQRSVDEAARATAILARPVLESAYFLHASMSQAPRR